MAELSTPNAAYKYLLGIGLEESVAKRLISCGRKTFEYFLRAIDA